MNTIRCYTTDEVADAFKLTKRAIYRHIANGDIKAVKIGNRYRVTENEMMRLLALNPQFDARGADV